MFSNYHSHINGEKAAEPQDNVLLGLFKSSGQQS